MKIPVIIAQLMKVVEYEITEVFEKITWYNVFAKISIRLLELVQKRSMSKKFLTSALLLCKTVFEKQLGSRHVFSNPLSTYLVETAVCKKDGINILL
jgi:hypothetical protein